MLHATLNTDGGSRGNPGTAGIGFVLSVDDGITYRGGSYIGETSNNVAEYTALVWGLENAKAAGVTDLDIRADSELMVNQLNGSYRVKNEGLKPLYAQVLMLLGAFENFTIMHVYRERNAEADALANEAMDARATVGDFLRKPTLKQSLFTMTSAPDITDPEPVLPVSDFKDDLAMRQSTATESPTSDDAPQRADDAFREVIPGTVPDENELEEVLIDEDVSDGGIYELTVKSHFDAAHALRGYPGQCSNLHGHTWDVEVSVEGESLDNIGILYDFKDLKEDLKTILDEFDHVYLNDLPTFADENPTAENLARIVYERLAKTLPPQVHMSEVCVWESPIARLRYRRLNRDA